MSKHNNVNPDHYKVSGREKPGESVAAKSPKQPRAMNREKAVGAKPKRRK
jgi:hypothetical protein